MKLQFTTKFKILTYMGKPVDHSMLEKGIYEAAIPYLKSIDTTIESMIDSANKMKDMTGGSFFSEKYIENLKLCSFEEVTLNAA